jgi:hypothetical protein
MKPEHKETLEILVNSYGAEQVLDIIKEIFDRQVAEGTRKRDELFESLRISIEIGNVKRALEKMDRLRRLI